MSPGRTRLVRTLVRLYPRVFRDRFGPSLEEALTDHFRDLRREPPRRRWVGRIRAVADVFGAALQERVRPSYSPPNPTPRTPGAGIMDRFLLDLRFAIRSLRRRPGFTATAVLTLALGIGANTAVFSVVYGVLLRPLPFPSPEELVMVWSHDAETPAQRGWMSLADLGDVRELGGVVALEGWQNTSMTFVQDDRPEEIAASRVTGSLLDVFDLSPQLGRDLRHEENNRGAPRVVVLGHRFWQSRLGGRADIVGTTVELSERAYEVVGVAPEGFDFPDEVQMWIPYRHPEEGCGRGCTVYQVVARMAPGTDIATHAQPLQGLAMGLQEIYPDTNTDKEFHMELLVDHMVGGVRAGLWVVLAAVALVLLIVCANLANLLLARASTRRSEVAVRSALGASGGRLIGQVLTESLVLSVVGAAFGVALSVLLLRGFVWLAPAGLPRLDEVGLNGPVLLFALMSTLVVATLFGLSPAMNLARTSAASGLAGKVRGGSRREGRARSVLMSVEIALSLSLLVGAALLTRSLGQLYRVDLGFDGEHVLRFSLSLPSTRYDTLPEFVSFYSGLEERIAGLPGVVAVGSAYGSPFGGGSMGGSVRLEGRPAPPPGRENHAVIRVATPGYFDAMGLALVRGRWIDDRDRTESEPVALVNESFAVQNFADEDPIGERVRVSSSFGYSVSRYFRVVGIVKDVRRTIKGTPQPAMYVPHSQFGAGFLRVHVRGASASVAGLMPVIREELAALDPNLAISNVHMFRDALRADAAPTRFYMLLVGIFAGLAVLVASVGLYGVVAYLVSGRTREFGIRMALGAQQPEIRRMVLRQGLRPTAWGVLAGVTASVVGVRWMESLLFGVDPRDPAVFALVSLLIVGVATAASLLPARRATRVDPTDALRAE